MVFVPLTSLVRALQGTAVADMKVRRISVSLQDSAAPIIFPITSSPQENYLQNYNKTALYVTTVDGDEPRCLTPFAGKSCQPDISPDGGKIVYLHNGDICLRDIDKSNETCLLPGAGNEYHAPRFTPDGKYILYQHVGNLPAGTIGTVVVTVKINKNGEVKSAAMTRQDITRQHIFRINVDGTGKRLLGGGKLADISPDSTMMLYTLQTGKEQQIALMDIDGNNHRAIDYGSSPVFNAAGDRVLYSHLFTTDKIKRSLLVSLPVSGGQVQPKTAAELKKRKNNESQGRFSPDSQKVVFEAGGIALRQVDSAGFRQLTTAKDSLPSFMLDGRHIIYLRDGGIMSPPSLMSITIDGDEEMALTENLDVHEYTLAPDGKHILFTAEKPAITLPDFMPDELKESSPAYTLEQAQAILKEVLPLVELQAGKTFKSIPVIKLANRRQLIPILTKETLQRAHTMVPDEAEEAKSMAGISARAYAEVLLGLYEYLDHTLYLAPGNLLSRMARAKIDRKYQGAILKLVIAHELTHALQDQEVDLGKSLRQANTFEKSNALSGTIEGHAVYVQGQVAGALHLEAAMKEMTRSLALGPFGEHSLLNKMTDHAENSLFKDRYLGGRDFIAWHAKQGGNERVWQILAAPPTQTRMLFHPERYSATPAPAVDYAGVLNGMMDRFGKRKWHVQNIEVGEMLLRASYAHLDATDREQLIANAEHVQLLMGSSNGDARGTLAMIVMKDPALAPAHVAATEKMTRKNIELLRKGKDIAVTNVLTGNFPGVKADVARQLTFTICSSGMVLPNKIVRIARGKYLLEIYTQKLALTDKDIAGIAEEVFTRLAKATAEK